MPPVTTQGKTGGVNKVVSSSQGLVISAKEGDCVTLHRQGCIHARESSEARANPVEYQVLKNTNRLCGALKEGVSAESLEQLYNTL